MNGLPRQLALASAILLTASLFAFILFFADYSRFSREARIVIGALCVGNIVLLVLEKPDMASRGPVSYDAFVRFERAFFILGFGLLALGFLRYAAAGFGFRRMRMVCLMAGFGALAIAGGLASRVVVGHGTSGAVHTTTMALRSFGLVAAPLLYLGLTPPALIARLFGETRESAL